MTDNLWVSPIHKASSIRLGNLDDAIAVFEAQVDGWILNHARDLAAKDHSGFAILLLITSYFEAIEPFYTGSKSGKTHEVFRAGLCRVFPELRRFADLALDSLYGELRCGLYHAASTGPRIEIAKSGTAFRLAADPTTGDLVTALVDPWNVLAAVEQHFGSYIAQLKDPANQSLRDAFAKYRRVSAPQLYMSAPSQTISSKF